MRIYLDICCLKRPFDDQASPRIAVETAAVLAVPNAIDAGDAEGLRSPAHDLENARNPDIRRATAVGVWLAERSLPAVAGEVPTRVRELVGEGLHAIDALHRAWAEALEADAFVTVDDRLRSRAERLRDMIRVRVTDPVALAAELTS